MGTAYVDCIRDGTVFKTYDFEFGGPVRPDFLPEPQKLVGTAMTNLINDRLALPPYAKIRFAVRYSDASNGQTSQGNLP